ncbi:MAG: WecB/TagA/CpsF family glycosyltransferase [Gemmatimonadaceae bacterium]
MHGSLWHTARDQRDAAPTSRTPLRQVRIGYAWIDALRLRGALEVIAELVALGRGGIVVTPNVDHVVRLERDAAFRDVYARADLVLADGAPILWAARLLGTRLPEKVSGSDLVLPLMQAAAERGWRVYLLGGAPGVADAAAELLRRQHRVNVVGVDSPTVTTEGDDAGERAIAARIRAARPDVVLVALGAPKQERLSARLRGAVAPAVLVGVGVSLSFLTGHVRRAPRWVSRLGLEWLHRLLQEPRRLWRRYLVEDPAFVGVVLRTWRLPASARVRTRPT